MGKDYDEETIRKVRKYVRKNNVSQEVLDVIIALTGIELEENADAADVDNEET